MYNVSVDNLGVVVTGAGNGIGRALALKLAAEGARVVVNDVDPAAVHAVADSCGALAWPGDLATAAGVSGLIDAARDHLGEVDIFFSNAGIDLAAGLDATDDQWALAMDVNLMAHVRAARLLVPGWVERGRGRFVVTASAAALLTAMQTSTYATSKHAALGFAEWLSVTYGGRGVVVQAICPGGVRTDMVAKADPAAIALVRDNLMEPEDLADRVWEAVQGEEFLILPEPSVGDHYREKAADHEGWLRMMRKVQRRFDAPAT